MMGDNRATDHSRVLSAVGYVPSRTSSARRDYLFSVEKGAAGNSGSGSDGPLDDIPVLKTARTPPQRRWSAAWHHFKQGTLLTALTLECGRDFASPSRPTITARIPRRPLLALCRGDAVEAFPRAPGATRPTAAGPPHESCARWRLPDIGRRSGSRGEVQSGGRKKVAILGDVCEAVIGALHWTAEDAERSFVAATGARHAELARAARDARPPAGMGEGQGPATPNYTISTAGPTRADLRNRGRGRKAPRTAARTLAARGEQEAETAVLRREGDECAGDGQ